MFSEEISLDDAYELLIYSWNRRDWVSRSTVTYSFDSETVLKRHVDLELALGLYPPPVDVEGYCALPLLELDRRMPHDLECFYGGLPMLTLHRADERRVVAKAIANFADVVGADFDPVECSHFSIDSPYYGTTPLHVADWFNLLAGTPDLLELVRTYQRQRIVIGLLVASEAANGIIVSYTNTERLSLKSSGVWTLFLTIRNYRRSESVSRAAWASLGVEWQLVVADGSSSHIERYKSNRDAPSREYRKAWRRVRINRDTFVAYIELPDVVESRSYNVAVETPPGVYIDSAVLKIFHFDGHTSSMLLIVDDDIRPERTHLHYSSNLLGSADEPEDYLETQLRLVLRPTYHNGLRSGRNLLALSSFTSWILAATVGWDKAKWHCVGLLCHAPTTRNFDQNSIVSLLVVAPSVAIGIYLRPTGDHPLTKRVQSAYRKRLAYAGLLSFLLALAIALDLRDGTAVGLLAVVVAMGHTALLALTQWSASRSKRRST